MANLPPVNMYHLSGSIHLLSDRTVASRLANIPIAEGSAPAARCFPAGLEFEFGTRCSMLPSLPTYYLRLSIDIISYLYMHVHMLICQGTHIKTHTTYHTFSEYHGATATSATSKLSFPPPECPRQLIGRLFAPASLLSRSLVSESTSSSLGAPRRAVWLRLS